MTTKEYYAEHKEEISNYNKEYIAKNKEKISEQRKEQLNIYKCPRSSMD